jgi:hypothetical protein
LQGVREYKHVLIEGFTPKGGIAVVANQLGVVAKTLVRVRNELMPKPSDSEGDYAQPSVFVVNGLLVSAATGLQGVMDAVASLCHTYAPDDEHDGLIYFDTYKFRMTDWDFISVSKARTISTLRYDGMDFNQLANRLKHHLPWLGIISTNPDGFNDVHDINGTGVLRGMLVPLYKIIKQIVQRLGDQFKQPINLPFV